MVDIFDEVADDLRSERALRLARRYGALAVAAAALVVVAVALQQAWSWRQAKRADAAAAAFIKIGEPIDGPTLPPGNDQRLGVAGGYVAFARTAPAGYRTLAELKAAGLYADAGQADAAVGLWNRVAADGAADRPLRELANLLWAQHELGRAPDAEVAARLAPLQAAANPFHGLAEETAALLYLRQGRIAQAKGLFTQIAADPGAPDGARNRADGLLAKLNG